jgi:hypothetical protein
MKIHNFFYGCLILFTSMFFLNAKAQNSTKQKLICLDIHFGKDSSATWDGKLFFADKNDANKCLYAGINMGYGKQGYAKQTDTMITWQGEAKARMVWDWVLKYNKIVEGYTPEKDKMPYKPFYLNVGLKAVPGAGVTISTVHGEFTFVPDKLEFGKPELFLEEQVSITRIYPAQRITDEEYIADRKKYHGYPAISSTKDGTTYITYSSYYEGISPYRYFPFTEDMPDNFDFLAQKADGDRINIIIEKDGNILEKIPVTIKGKDITNIATVLDRDNTLWIAWSENVDSNKDIYYTTFKNNKTATIKRLTSSPGPDIHPVLAANNKGVWIAWQGFRNNSYNILYTMLSGSDIQEKSIGDPASNQWQPAIASDSKENIAIAWDTYQNKNYDVYYTILSDIEAPVKQMPVATTLDYEVRPSLVFDNNDRLWIAYEKAGENWGKDYGVHYFIKAKNTEGLYKTRSLRVVCIDNGKFYTTPVPVDKIIPKVTRYTLFYNIVRSPEKYKTAFEPHHYLNAPTLAKTPHGHILLVYKTNAEIDYTIKWQNCFTCFNGKSWSKPVKIGGSFGQMHEIPAIATSEAFDAKVAQASDYEAGNGEIKTDDLFRQNIWLAELQVPDELFDFELKSIEPPQLSKIPKHLIQESKDVETIQNYRTTVNGKTYRILKGDTHRHSSFSGDGAGDSEIEDSYRYALDAAKLDWMNNGDHDNGYNEYHWNLTQKYTDVFNLNNSFIGLFGYERSCGYPDGHRNVVFAQRGIRMLPRVRYKKSDFANTNISPDTRLLYRYLEQFDGICISHTSATKAAGTDWRELNTEHEPVMEIYQGERMSAECRTCPRFRDDLPWFGMNKSGFFRDALAKGHHLGVISSSDHKSTHVSFAMVYVEEFTREGIMDGLKKRHTYGATDNIVLDVKMNGHLMGDVIQSKERKLDIHVTGTDKIKEIVVVKDNKEYKIKHNGKKEVTVSWEDKKITDGESYYYVRVLQENGELAWSSPVWVSK